MEENKKSKAVHRLIPCPNYDVAGTEQWLTDMAANGLMLQCDGFFMGIASFEKTAPQRVKYRMLPANKNTSFWASDNGEPDTEEIELSKEFGWEYVVKRGEFYIYRTTDMGARELHTDKEVQALAMKAMRKRQWEYLLVSLPLTVLYLWLVFGSKLFVSMIHVGTALYSLLAFSVLWSLVETAVRAVKILKLRKQMMEGSLSDVANGWRDRAWGYHIRSVLGVLLSIAAFFLIMMIVLKYTAYADYIPQKEYTGNPPFATMEDFLPGGARKLVNMTYGNMNTVREWSDPLSAVNYEWDEVAEVMHPDGRKLSGGLEVIYHEPRTEWLAKRIAEEYLLKGKQEKEYEALELELEGVDTVYAYTSHLHFPCIILQIENKVLFARFYTSGAESIRLEVYEWADVMAESLKNK